MWTWPVCCSGPDKKGTRLFLLGEVFGVAGTLHWGPVTLPFPTRVPLFPAVVFTSVLVIVQLAEGTDPRYSALIFVFFMLSVFAFNVAEGLARPAGAYILFFSLLVVDVGTVYKALLGQAAQTNLEQPLLVMSTYVGTMGAMLIAALISRKFVTTKHGLAGLLQVGQFDYRASALGCLVVYGLMITAATTLPEHGGQVLHSLIVVNPFLPLSVLLATVAAVKDSGGRRSTSIISLVGMAYIFGDGLTAFSKQGMFLPVVCWLIGAAWARYRLRLKHLVFIVCFCVFAQTVLVQISANRNDVQTGTLSERVGLIEHYLTHIPELRRRAREWQPPSDLDWRNYYYGSPQGLFDRLTMLPNDSVLISFSDQGHYFGYRAIGIYFEDWIPHLLSPHKLAGVSVGGNAYSHEMGGLADSDTTTGISFSPTAEAYHIDGWRGVLLLQPLIYLMLFASTSAVCGDIRRQPWGLFLVLDFAHVAPEAMLGGAISATRLGNIGIALAIFFCGYITPVLGMLLSGRRMPMDREITRSSTNRFRGGLQAG